MAANFIQEELKHELTSIDDIAKPGLAGQNIPLTGILFGIDQTKMDEAKKLSVLTMEGSAYNVKIEIADWEKWRDVRPGMIITFDGDVSVVKGPPLILATSSPIIEDSNVTLARTGLPFEDIKNTAIVATIIEVKARKDEITSPLTIKCSGNGEIFNVKTFVADYKSMLQKIKPGNIINIAPVNFKYEKWTDLIGKERITPNFYIGNNTVICIAGDFMNSEPKLINQLSEIEGYPYGSLLSMKCVLLRDVRNGSTMIVDVPGVHDGLLGKAPKIPLFKIPSTMNYKAGNVITLTAIVESHDIVKLNYKSMSRDNEEDNATCENFNSYKYIENTTFCDMSITSPMASQESSQLFEASSGAVTPIRRHHPYSRH